MARKSKELLLREGLRAISDCPFDILRFACEDDVFSLLPKCEQGDAAARLALCRAIISECGGERVDALEYLLHGGLDRGCKECLSLALRYICTARVTPVALAKRCIALSDDAGMDVLGAIARVAVAEKSISDREVGLLSSPDFAAVPLYLLPREDGRIRELAAMAAVPSILSLPTFSDKAGTSPDADHFRDVRGADTDTDPADNKDTGNTPDADHSRDVRGADTDTDPTDNKDTGNTPDANPDGLAHFLRHAGELHDPEWRDFWLRCGYEYALGYEGGIRDFATLALPIITTRTYAERHPIHLLAAAAISGTVDDSALESMRRSCEFAGFDTEKLDTGAALREAAYLDSPREIALANERERRGGMIIHTRNRYSLTHNLSGHAKRARLHLWQTPITVMGERMPTFTEAKIEQVSCTPERNGITLERDAALCQVLCHGEIIFADSRHPFVIDLILDMAFVSATKCHSLEIRPREFVALDGMITMDCQVFLK